ncbi:unnamed protein product [Lampetra planeri]
MSTANVSGEFPTAFRECGRMITGNWKHNDIATALPPFHVCPSVFEVPANYHRRGGSRHTPMSNNDEELLQYAIHQSLLGVPVGGRSRSIPEGVLIEYGDTSSPASSLSATSPDSDLHLAMELSARAQEQEEKLRKQEEEELGNDFAAVTH